MATFVSPNTLSYTYCGPLSVTKISGMPNRAKTDLRIPIIVWEDVKDSCTTSGNLEKLSTIKR